MRTLTLLVLMVPAALGVGALAQEEKDGVQVEQRAGAATRTWFFTGGDRKLPTVAMSEVVPVMVQVEKAVEFEVRDLLPGWKQVDPHLKSDVGLKRIILAPLAPGERQAGFTVRYRLEKGEWINAEFPPVLVRVTAKAKDEEPRDITGPQTTPKSQVDIGSMPFVVALAAAAGIGYFVYRWVMTTKAHKSPEDLALRSIARLQALKLPERNQSERHVAILSRIARRYIDRKFSMASRRQTTAEFLAAARATPALQPHIEYLSAFLEKCDLAKFAPPDAAPQVSKQLEIDLQSWLMTREG